MVINYDLETTSEAAFEVTLTYTDINPFGVKGAFGERWNPRFPNQYMDLPS
jgi:hypothetical protein